MDGDRTLFEMYAEYRSGNRNILEKLFSLVGFDDKDGKYKTEFKINNSDLNKMVYRAISSYSASGYNSSQQKISLDEMKAIFCEAIIELFNEDGICDNSSLFSKLKAKVLEPIKAIKDISSNEISSYVKGDDGKMLDLIDVYTCDENEPANSGYRNFMQKMIMIVKNYDISEMLPKDNIIARNLIKLLLMPEFPEMCDRHFMESDESVILSNSKIIDLYHIKYNKRLCSEQISQGYLTIYQLLMKCCYGYVPCGRVDFCKASSVETNYYNVIANSTAYYIDDVVNGRKTCSRKALDNLKKCIDYSVDRTVFDLNRRGVVIDKFKILDIIFNRANENKVRYWYLNKKLDDKKHRTVKLENRMKLRYFYCKSGNRYSEIRSVKAIEFNSIPKVYQFGSCCVIIDSESRNVWYLPSNNRIMYAIRRGEHNGEYIALLHNSTKTRNKFVEIA